MSAMRRNCLTEQRPCVKRSLARIALHLVGWSHVYYISNEESCMPKKATKKAKKVTKKKPAAKKAKKSRCRC